MISFRKAKHSDVDLYYEWANDPLVRSNAFSTNHIEYESHCQWFSDRIGDPNCSMYIFYGHADIIGQVRIEVDNSIGIIDVSIDQAHRGKGYACQLLSLSTDAFFYEFTQVNTLRALVKTTNSPSRKSFLNAHFIEKMIKDNSFYVLEYDRV